MVTHRRPDEPARRAIYPLGGRRPHGSEGGPQMPDSQRRGSSSGVRFGTAAAVALVLGVVAAIVLSGRTARNGVTGSPASSSLASTSAAASASSAGSPNLEQSQTPASSPRASGPLGAANAAVLVRMLGGTIGRPDEIEVSFVTLDAGAYETRLQPRVIARIPGPAVPDEVELLPGGAKYGQAGWLAVEGGLRA